MTTTVCVLLGAALLLGSVKIGRGAELAIHIPGNLGQEGVIYRLDYYPPFGHPAPNTTIASKNIRDVIKFSQALPGTKYDFWLYYSNSSHNTLTWTANFTTVPDPPSNLSVSVRSGKSAVILWSPPAHGGFSSFKLKINSLNNVPEAKPQTLTIDNVDTTNYFLKELTPGATYQVQAFTVFENKESAAYTSRNFTTKPNTPGKFIVWFRNETTLLVLWQPPYPAAIYTHYKVSIDPPDANDSILYVEKEGEPPGPAQAAFKGLVPGRAYNISVQTMSEDEISTPTTAQYRTVPLKPAKVTFNPNRITSHSFVVSWEEPNGKSEFDKYHVFLGMARNKQQITKLREEPTFIEFKENLEPGKTYTLTVKTVSGKVSSWPTTADVTLKPLPVTDLVADTDDKNGVVNISWTPNPESFQDNYLVSYHEVESSTGDSNNVKTDNQTRLTLDTLLPGRNYSIIVQALSKDMESDESYLYVVTQPSAPIIEDLRPLVDGLNISWKSDVNSRQDKYELHCVRNDTLDQIVRTTHDSRMVLSNLYPGAGYLVKVFAISHGLKSEPHEYFQPVFPRPPKNMTIEKTTTTSVLVLWVAPTDSLISEYAIRYRTDSDKNWVKLPAVQNTEAEVTDMTPGERYTIQVNTVSYGLESNEPQQMNHTVRPNPVSNIAPLIDSNNVTLEWPRPEGRVETYIVRWWEGTNSSQINTRNVSQGENGTNPVRLLVGDLMPGVEYTFDIQAISNGLDSDVTVVKTRTMPLIQSEVVVVTNQQSTDTISLRYTPTPRASSKFDFYRFSLSEVNIPDQEKTENDTDRFVTFKGLVPGRLYNITVWTVSQNVASQPLQRQDRLYPEPITGINATSVSDTEVTLAWASPRGEYNAFEVQYLIENTLIHNLTLQNSITITGLKPHRNYTFTVMVRSGTESSILRQSLPVSAIFTTKESVPGRVERFEPVDIQPSSVTFEWSLPPTEQNGVIRKFTITYGPEGSSHTLSRDFKPQELRGVIRQLLPGKTYIFRIQGETRVGFGPERVWKQRMPIREPPVPSFRAVPSEVRRSSTTIQIRFRKNYFSDANGPVTTYAIIVAEDYSKNASGLEMPSWRDVQAYSVWPPYQVSEPYYPFFNNSVEDFTIGAESCDIRQVGYCNGALKSGSTYRVKIRAFTAPDKFTDTSYSFPIQTDQDNTNIILGVLIPLILFGILFLVIIYIRRRRSAGRKATDTRTNDNMSLPDSVIETSRPVRIENFANHYRLMSADSDFRFSEEFEELKHVGRDQPCTFADLPCNRPKNRFTNILPYDHSRFKLQPVDDEEGSDYVNANYVPGYNSPREFIVTQGPLHSTRDDFWRMVWESNSRAIIMLTRCVEKGREKCDHYWPYESMPVYYGDISVQILNETRYPDWNISEFMVCRVSVQSPVRSFALATFSRRATNKE
jgi:receptor-type tyrosine-protein phosphatase beta